jgi:hypothetical protein
MNKKIKIVVGIVLFIVIFFVGTYVGGKTAEKDINSRVKKGEIFASAESLNKINPENNQICDETVNIGDIKYDATNVQDVINGSKGILRAADEIASSQIVPKIMNKSLYKKLTNKTKNEFLDANFVEAWGGNDGSYANEHALEFSDAKKLQKKILEGDIYFQDFGNQTIYYAKNYFKWTKEKINHAVDFFCDGIGCNVPTVIMADNNYIFWTSYPTCSGGFRPVEAISIEDYYKESKCSIVSDAIQSFEKNNLK